MNIIINGFLDIRTLPVAKKILSSFNINGFIFTYDYLKPNFGRLNSKAILLNWRKINFESDYNIDMNTLEPIDEELIDSMRECETITLKMMDRLETYKDYSYEERKELYLNHLRFWNHMLKDKKIDLFLSQNIPHETSDFVCYSLCKLKKIPTLIIYQTHVPDTCLLLTDIEKSDYGLENEYLKLKTKLGKTKIEDIKFSPRFEKYYDFQTNPTGNITPFYMKRKPLLPELIKKIQTIFKKIKRNPTVYFQEGKLIAVVLIRRFFKSFQTRNLMHFYEKNCTEFNTKDKYYYVALHLQPEMTTSPRADAYVDQILIVQLLSALAPKDVKILVKEHPNQTVLGRSKKYYQTLLSLDNVALMSRKVSTKELVAHSQAVVTCVGLVGFESLFKGKPVLMFGHSFYQSAPGVFQIRTKEDLAKAIKQLSQKTKFSPKDFKIYLKALDNVAINANSEWDYLPTSVLSEKDNTSNMSTAIIKAVKNKKSGARVD